MITLHVKFKKGFTSNQLKYYEIFDMGDHKMDIYFVIEEQKSV